MNEVIDVEYVFNAGPVALEDCISREVIIANQWCDNNNNVIVNETKH